tara:strand:+ start:979 stop:1107 length:129 start_codon:yes stop_codon:yes gene_type:complete
MNIEEILKNNIAEMQKQLHHFQTRVSELISENEELKKRCKEK